MRYLKRKRFPLMSFESFPENSHGGEGARSIIEDNWSSHLHFNNMPANAMVTPRFLSQSLSASSIFNPPGLFLALCSNLEGRREALPRMAEAFEPNLGKRSREELEHESRSGSENIVDGSGDDQDTSNGNPPRKKRHHRHTPQQIQELELVFKECPHPDEKQRLELGRRLGLETRQVKFWFQNRRTQMTTQLERHEHAFLRQENDKLRSENLAIRDAMRNPNCSNCGGPSMIGEISREEQQLRIQNAQLKDEMHRAFFLAGRFLGRPISTLGTSVATPLPGSNLEVGVGMTGFGGLTLPASVPLWRDSVVGVTNNLHSPGERSMFLKLALAAMNELVKMAQTDEPLWTRNSDMGREILNQEDYIRMFPHCIGFKPNGFASEASRQSSVVIINSVSLVETLMDSNRWAEMFPGLIARATTTDVISSGVGGTRNCALQLMEAEFQVLSPFVPVRAVSFLRFCKQRADGAWAVVDVSIEPMKEAYSKPRRLPSGCVVQDMPNGCSKVTWVEHAEYEESQIHHLYRPLVSSGMGFGAPRWLAALQRHCQFLAILMSPSLPPPDHFGEFDAAITPAGRRSMLEMAQRMTENFCAGMCWPTMHKWNKLHSRNVDENIRVVTQKSVNDSGDQRSLLLGAATSVWLPVSPQRLFAFLRDQRQRSEWDVLSNGGPMQEMTHIPKGHDQGNCVSLLRANAMNANQSSMLILQQTCTDAAGSLVVYAPVDLPAMHVVMNGGDSSSVALPPSGFGIVPDGRWSAGQTEGINGSESGSLLTAAFQILVNSLPTGKLPVESEEAINNLISSAIQKIKAALARCENL